MRRNYRRQNSDIKTFSHLSTSIFRILKYLLSPKPNILLGSNFILTEVMGGKGVHSWMDDVHNSNVYKKLFKMRLEIFSQLNVWPCEYFRNWTYLQFSKQGELMQLA